MPQFIRSLAAVLFSTVSLVASFDIRPFKVDFSPEDVAAMKAKAVATALPREPQFVGWGWDLDRGFPVDDLDALRNFWVSDEYDWVKEQGLINEYAQYIVNIEGLDIHYIHQLAEDADSIPLILFNGWGGAFIEFVPVIDKLTDGSNGNTSFHVVVPSIPGFDFSSAPPLDWTASDLTRVFRTLMVDVLGYDEFMVFGNDWGAWFAYELYTNFTENVRAAHFGTAAFLPPTRDQVLAANLSLSAYETESLDIVEQWMATGTGYFSVQSGKPNTLGLALYDSPVGQLSWIGSGFRLYTGPNAVNPISDTAILNFITLTYLSKTFLSAIWLYTKGAFPALTADTPPSNISTPMGYTAYRYNAVQYPRAFLEKTGNLTYYHESLQGGHFPALDDVDTFVSDIRETAKFWPQ